jgi:hypothetical protein
MNTKKPNKKTSKKTEVEKPVKRAYKKRTILDAVKEKINNARMMEYLFSFLTKRKIEFIEYSTDETYFVVIAQQHICNENFKDILEINNMGHRVNFWITKRGELCISMPVNIN